MYIQISLSEIDRGQMGLGTISGGRDKGEFIKEVKMGVYLTKYIKCMDEIPNKNKINKI